MSEIILLGQPPPLPPKKTNKKNKQPNPHKWLTDVIDLRSCVEREFKPLSYSRRPNKIHEVLAVVEKPSRPHTCEYCLTRTCVSCNPWVVIRCNETKMTTFRCEEQTDRQTEWTWENNRGMGWGGGARETNNRRARRSEHACRALEIVVIWAYLQSWSH